ncbi:MAG: peptide-N-glycosidase F-related protein, partial [Chlorobi bacterium]|nr:peptide-N-glycosidase F-related protein [Chlorobiota bacterium]
MTNVFALVLCCSTLALAIDTLHIPILTRERFPSQPSEKRTKVGLPADRSFARLMLCVRLDCPCGPGLGEWDYTVRFFVTRPSGQFDSTGAPIPERIEIARFITPYAANRPSTWNWTWQWDVTDYRFLFSDSTDLIVQYQGWTQSALFTVWLDAIAGVPPYTVFALDQLIEGSFPYGKIDDPIDRYTTGKRFRVPPNAEMVQLRITTTGHGFGGTDNAAEFAEKIHTVVVGTTQFSQHLWRDDCGWNPVYPQDGTWPLSRAGWCPGDVVYPWQQWITSVVQPGTEATFDYRMQPFVNEQFDAHPSSYLVNAQVLYARRPALERRATLVAVRAPNAAPPHQRINPTCGHPQIVVRNDGRDSIASLRLEYTFDNGMPQQFLWRAPTPLGLSDTVTIELPSMTPQLDTPAVRRFTVRIADVNGQPNQEAVFDRMTV